MPDVQIHHKYQKEICKRFLFRRIHHDIAFPIEGGGRIFWSYVYPRAPGPVRTVMRTRCCLNCVSHPCARCSTCPPYLKLTFTQLSGVTLRAAVVVLAAVTANAASNPSLRQEININVNARAPKSKMCQSEFSYHNKVNNRTAVPRSHLL